MILDQFDKTKKAVVNPEIFYKPNEDFPKAVVCCFSELTFDRLVKAYDGKKIASITNANGKHLIYQANYQNHKIALFKLFVGAPMAIVALEELRAQGAEKFVIFGTCGTLDSNIEDCQIIVPTAAIRDEGTSYHYAPSSDEIAVNQKYGPIFKAILEQRAVNYAAGKVWTTDAFYRETPQKVANRRRAGCICVDMECSAVAAFAQFRGVDVLHFFYATDNLDSDEWQIRSLANRAALDKKDKVAQLAIEMAVEMFK